MTDIRFDNQVAVITGAGGGLGKSHALFLASRGARVVVNDLGATRDGQGASLSPAEQVVATITAAGGQAVANTDNIATPEGAEHLIAQALSAFGRVDMLVNNAGFLRDKSFAKMSLDDFEAVVRVHLMGSVYCCKAVWPVMQTQSYGRIVMTTSAAGLYGNFGQANYGAAKLGVIGLMMTLKLEGARHGIRVNTIAPVAATRMTEGTVAPDIVARTPPEMVSPAVAYLCSQACELNGEILVAGGSHFALARIVETPGITLSGSQATPEAIAARLGEIGDLAAARPYDDAVSSLRAALHLED